MSKTKPHYLQNSETRSIVLLASSLIGFVGVAMLGGYLISGRQAVLFATLFTGATLGIVSVSALWLRRVHGSLTRLRQQLIAARADEVAYTPALTDESLFAGVHDDLYAYVRETQALRTDLNRDREQLQRAITDIAHQLRTPISVISNLSELLTPANAPATQEALQRQNTRLTELVEQLILMARVDTHTLSQDKQAVGADELMRQSLTTLLRLVADRELTLDWQIPDDLIIQVNPILMREAMSNLLKNAIEHAPFGSVLTVSATVNPVATTLTIQNAGAAIPAADLPHLFERFYRGAQSTPNSLGVGLAIADGIVRASDGRLMIENVPGGVRTQIELFC